MRPYSRRVRVASLDDEVHLYPTGDWHVGEAGCAEGRLRRAVAYMARDPVALVLLMGDLGGWIAPDDRRWDPSSVAQDLSILDLSDWGEALVERVVELAEPLRGRILGMLEGNHEAVFGKRHHLDVTRRMAERLGCEVLGYSGFVDLQVVAPEGQRTLRIMATHGSGGAQTLGGKINRLERLGRQHETVDLVCMGHVHACLDAWLSPRLGVRDGVIHDDSMTLGVITGTYLRTYTEGHSGYGERAGYDPTQIGHPCVVWIPRTGELWVRWIFRRTLGGSHAQSEHL